MPVNLKISNVYAREILDSRGNPTIETEVEVQNGQYIHTGRAAVPSGASTGKHEAVELRDNEMGRYGGLGVHRAAENVNTIIREVLMGKNAMNQLRIDYILRTTDGTEDKSRLGANALLSASMACADAAAKALHMPLYRYLGGVFGVKMPVPMMNILNGGKHAANTVDFQEFMIMPVGAVDEHGTFVFREGLQWCVEVYHTLQKLLNEKGLSTAVGDEGGFAPDLKDAEEVFDYLVRAVELAGYRPGKDIAFAMDAAASELFNPDSGLYHFSGAVQKNTDEMISYYEHLVRKYPLISIEDGLQEDDWDGWVKLTKALGHRVQLVGDDLFVTNVDRLREGIRKGAGNAILIKVNQIGTLSEAMDAIVRAKQAGFHAVVSHRSGETEDPFIADLAVALNCGQIKTGAPCRGERTAKYNQLLRIEEEVGSVMQEGF